MRVQRRAESRRSARPITRTATEARQGEIILGPRGRWIWIGAFAGLIVLGIYLAAAG